MYQLLPYDQLLSQFNNAGIFLGEDVFKALVKLMDSVEKSHLTRIPQILNESRISIEKKGLALIGDGCIGFVLPPNRRIVIAKLKKKPVSK